LSLTGLESETLLGPLLAQDPRLPAVWAWVQASMTFDAAHDAAHLERVARWTLRCAPDLAPGVALAAALTHDVVNLPKNHPERAQASTLAAAAVRDNLPELGFDGAEAEAVAAAVRDHSYSRGATPETVLGAALQDADRLDALGALGILRAAAAGGSMGRALLHATDPFCTARTPDDTAYTIDHFFTKLLRLEFTFQTPVGRQEAARRTAIMWAFLATLGEEVGAEFLG
jgi:uncharacterized protein